MGGSESKRTRRAESRLLHKGQGPPHVAAFIGNAKARNKPPPSPTDGCAAAAWLAEAIPVGSVSSKVARLTEQLLASPEFATALGQRVDGPEGSATLWERLQSEMVATLEWVAARVYVESLAQFPYAQHDLISQEDPKLPSDHIGAFASDDVARPCRGYSCPTDEVVEATLLAEALASEVEAELGKLAELVGRKLQVQGGGVLCCTVRAPTAPALPGIIDCRISTTSSRHTRMLVDRIANTFGDIAAVRSLPQLIVSTGRAAEAFHALDGSVTARYHSSRAAAELAADPVVQRCWRENAKADQRITKAELEARSRVALSLHDRGRVDLPVVIRIQPTRRAQRSDGFDRAAASEIRRVIRNSYIIAAAESPAVVTELARQHRLWGDSRRLYVGGPQAAHHAGGTDSGELLEPRAGIVFPPAIGFTSIRRTNPMASTASASLVVMGG